MISTRVCFRVTLRELAQLRQLAAEAQCPLATLIRDAVADYVESAELLTPVSMRRDNTRSGAPVGSRTPRPD